MAFELMPLPYDQDALAPAISAETLGFHHDKHHKAYIDKTNAAIEGTDNAGKSLEEVIAAARGSSQGLFNNAAQSWNHGFYWHSLSPSGASPSGDLASKIDAAFGSRDALTSKLAERGAGHFASGWVWLADRGGQLTIDVWEHAYYLDYQNARPAYLKAVLDGHLNWDFAAENLARGTAWKYPG
jgi:Fe-Mn family superoxide dismutase